MGKINKKRVTFLTLSLFLISSPTAIMLDNKMIENLDSEYLIEPVVASVELTDTKQSTNTEYNEFVSTIAEFALEMKEEERQKSNQIKKKNYIDIDVEVTYYTGLASENGSKNAGKNAIGGYLSNTSIAIPRKDDLVKYGTKIEFSNLGKKYMDDYNGKHLIRIADDCGRPKHIRVREDGVYRMDVYCPRIGNETDDEYWSRVDSYGKYKTTAKVYLN